MLFVLVLQLLCILYPVFSFLSEEDVCVLPDNSNGICKRLHDCPTAIRDIKKKQYPQTCGFDQFVPIVCCTDTSPPAPPEIRNYGKVSAEKCVNYAGLVFHNYSSPTLMPGVLFEIEDTCAIKLENYRESNVLAREFPHSASIGYDHTTGRVWKCSGALISDQYVLTAASCYKLPKLGLAKYVRVGSTSTKENFYHEKPLQHFNIGEFIKNPMYNPQTLFNNLALVKLDAPVKFTSIVRPACLSIKRNWEREAINLGWGTFHEEGYMNNEPLKNLLKVVDGWKCNGLESNQFCVEQVPGTMWQNCLADQGGPLLVYNKDNYCTYDVVGIVSSWDDCRANKPGIYTNITSAIPWIEKIVWNNK